MLLLPEECAACEQQSGDPKPSISLDVEAVDATAADEIIGLVQGFLLQVLGGVAVLRHDEDVILQSKGELGEPRSQLRQTPSKMTPKSKCTFNLPCLAGTEVLQRAGVTSLLRSVHQGPSNLKLHMRNSTNSLD